MWNRFEAEQVQDQVSSSNYWHNMNVVQDVRRAIDFIEKRRTMAHSPPRRHPN